VCADLENLGYQVAPFIIPASAVNAPHQRERVWFVAYSNSNGFNQRNCNDEINTSERGINAQCNIKQSNVNGNATNTDLQGFNKFNIATESNKTQRFDSQANFGSGYKCWENFPTQSPICGGDDELPTELDGITFPKWRNESIKAYGNAIVPQVVYQIFKAIEQYESKG
jgi:DNA (cytosine-5)-methyltransferase 1